MPDWPQPCASCSRRVEQQTATSEVLRVISSSPGNLEPVFQTMLTNAVRICKANFGNMYLRDGEVLPSRRAQHAASAGRGTQAHALARRPQLELWAHGADETGCPCRRSLGRSKLSRSGSRGGFSGRAEADIRTILFVPMLKDAELVGAIIIYRQDVRPFAGRQIELVRGFASQAVIAIENTRLLNELRESLQQQTATSEVLQVISSSPGELQPVFEIMLANATRLCGAKFGPSTLRRRRIPRHRYVQRASGIL